MHPDSEMYASSYVFTLEGDVNEKAVREAWDQVVRRHDALRTLFNKDKGEPQQIISQSYDLSKIYIYDDFSGLKDVEVNKNLESMMSSRSLFDLGKGPLHFVYLIKIRKNVFKLIIFIHHILIDYDSFNLLMREFSQIYNGQVRGENIILPEITLGIGDYLKEEKDFFKKFSNKMEIFWSDALKGCNALKLKEKRPSKPLAKRSYFFLSNKIFEDLLQLARKNETTFFNVFAACYFTFLHGITRQEDITIAYPSGRRIPGFSLLVGFFINNLPLRVNFDHLTTFSQIVEFITNFMKRPGYYDYYPTYEIAKIAKKYSKSSGDIFDNVFSSANFASGGFQLDNIKVISELTQIRETTKNLLFLFDNQGQDVRCAFDYRQDLYSKKEIDSFINIFKTVVSQALKNPNFIVKNLFKDQKSYFSKSWSLGEKKGYRAGSIIQLIEEGIQSSDKSRALVFDDKTLSYQVLNEQVNQAARYLQEIGVGKEKIIAVKLQRGFDQIIWILAILKAGGAYLPIDSSYPIERQKYILEDSQAALLLTDDELGVDESIAGTCVVIHTPLLAEVVSSYSRENLDIEIKGNDLAYVIYTSGSTGKPKGVMIEHGSLANLAQAQAELFEINSKSHILQFASIGFDAAVSEWSTSLISGACLFLMSEREEEGNIVEALSKNKEITIATLPPSLAKVLPIESLPKLETLIVAGEACDEGVVEKWSKPVKLINAYGPTESTVCATAFVCDKAYPAKTIGKPIANSEVYILDDNKELVPEGVVGELYLGGIGLARGYLNRPELTAERFVTIDIEGRGEVRLYRSGDLGRWLEGGYIEYIGREDEQVKVRGYRIELGEIEETIKQVAGVQSAVVLAEGQPLHLVSYIVAENMEDEGSLSRRVRSVCQELLPSYMVPSACVVLPEFPLTPHGKIDAAALKAVKEKIEKKKVKTEEENITETEKSLIKALSRTLKKDKIKVDDDFFTLGGDSILSIQYANEAKKEGFNFSINQLFENPTVRQLAKIFKNHTDLKKVYPSILHRGKKSVPLSFSQQRMWFVNQLVATPYVYNIPLGIDLQGDLNIASLRYALNQVAQRHEVLRSKIQKKNGSLIQLFRDHSTTELEIYDLTHVKTKKEIKEKILIFAKSKLDIENGETWRSFLFKVKDRHHILLVVMHHIVTDGWSLGIFNRDISYYYSLQQRRREENNNETLQYGDYAIWQQEWLQGDVLEDQLKYWKNQLENIPVITKLPSDYSRPKKRNNKGRHYSYKMDENLLKKLREFSEKNEVSLFMTLLAVFQLLIHRYTQQENIVVGSPIANRHYPGVENIIGFFVNTLALKTYFDKEMTFATVLKNVKKTTLESYQNQDLPFEKLVEHMDVERNLGWHPIFQIMFSFDNLNNEKLDFSGLIAKPVDIDLGIAKFDLSLHAREEKDHLSLIFEYAEDLFSQKTIQRMMDHFVLLMSRAIHLSDENILSISMISDNEQRFLHDYSKGESNTLQSETVVDLFEKQLKFNPNAAAIFFNKEEITYDDLGKRVNKFALYLQNKGIGKGSVVPVILKRSMDLVVSILAILKAGGSYLPLEHNSPKERVEMILSDISASTIITDGSTISKYAGVYDIDLDYLNDRLDEYPEEKLNTHPELGDIAYVIYTSGSTGKPKGVMVEHKNLMNYLNWCSKNYPSSENFGAILHS